MLIPRVDQSTPWIYSSSKLQRLHNTIHSLFLVEKSKIVKKDLETAHEDIVFLMGATGIEHKIGSSQSPLDIAKQDTTHGFVFENDGLPTVIVLKENVVNIAGGDSPGVWLRFDSRQPGVESFFSQYLDTDYKYQHDSEFIPWYDLCLVKRPDRIDKEIKIFDRIEQFQLKDFDKTVKFPVAAEPLLVGRRIQVHKLGNKVIIYDYKGVNITNDSSVVVSEILRLNYESVILECVVGKMGTIYVIDVYIKNGLPTYKFCLYERKELLLQDKFIAPMELIPYEIKYSLSDIKDKVSVIKPLGSVISLYTPSEWYVLRT